jgi:hypothetical protein
MDHDIAPSADPDCIVEMPARFAEHVKAACFISQRVLELKRSKNGILGVLVTAGDPLYGPMDVSRAAIDGAATLQSFIGDARLDAQRTANSEFRRIFNGPLRSAMASIHDAFAGQLLYLAFYEEGVCAIVPSKFGRGRWRLASLRFVGAVSMDEERACVQANRMSRSTFGVLWGILVEKARREVEADPGLRKDLMDEPRARSATASGGAADDGPPPYDAPPFDAPPFDGPSYDDREDQGYDGPSDWDDVPPSGPPSEGPPPLDRSFDDEEDAIDDQAIDAPDPTERSMADEAERRRPPPPANDPYDTDDIAF